MGSSSNHFWPGPGGREPGSLLEVCCEHRMIYIIYQILGPAPKEKGSVLFIFE